MQAELDDKQAKEQAEMQKAANEAMRLEIERFKAETDRIKAEADAALKANQDLTDSEKVQADMEMKKLLEDMRQDHDIEMAILNSKLSAGIPPSPLELANANNSLTDDDEEQEGAQRVSIDRDAMGNVTGVNGRPVVRDAEGNIVGLA
jgi:membrane protein involved in colicin uptake